MHQPFTPGAAEADVRAFAAQFPTPQVRRMLALCEAGTIAWTAAAALAERSLKAGIAAAADEALAAKAAG